MYLCIEKVKNGAEYLHCIERVELDPISASYTKRYFKSKWPLHLEENGVHWGFQRPLIGSIKYIAILLVISQFFLKKTPRGLADTLPSQNLLYPSYFILVFSSLVLYSPLCCFVKWGNDELITFILICWIEHIASGPLNQNQNSWTFPRSFPSVMPNLVFYWSNASLFIVI